MLNDEICKLRDKLNKSIEQGDDYSVTYQLSVELDELIAQYYHNLKKSKKKWYGWPAKLKPLKHFMFKGFLGTTGNVGLDSW